MCVFVDWCLTVHVSPCDDPGMTNSTDPFEEAALELGCPVDEVLGSFPPSFVGQLQRGPLDGIVDAEDALADITAVEVQVR